MTGPGTSSSNERQDNGPPDLRLRRRFFSWPTLIGYVIATAVIAVAASRVFDIDWGETWELVRSTDPVKYVLAMVLYYVSFWFRGWRWLLIIKSTGPHEQPGVRMPSITVAGGIILMGWFANSVAFMRLGDAFRSYAFARESRTRFSGILGTVLGERVQDMAAVLVLLLVAAIAIWISDSADAPAWVIAAAIGLVVALMVLLVMMRFLGPIAARRLPPRLRDSYENFQSGALSSFRPRQMPAQFTLGLIGWGFETARLYFVADGMGFEMSIWVALFAALANALLTTIPTPGGAGFVEGGLTGVLILLGMGNTDAFALTVVDRTISWISIIVFGGGLFAAWQIWRVKKLPDRARYSELAGDLPGPETGRIDS